MADKLSAFLMLVLISPIVLLITFILFTFHKRIIYRQLRPGLNEKLFHILKFETFGSDQSSSTLFQRILRKTHLNEIPQLFNILKGEMSWVGPRPLLPEYLEMYDEIQKRRHEVKPGIFGLAQLNEKNLKSWEEKFEYDFYYVNNIGFLLDLKIILLSIKQTLSGQIFDRANSLTRFIKDS